MASQQESSPLRTAHGDTTIANEVISKVVGIAAQGVPGVQMGGGGSGALGGFMESVTGGSSSNPMRGVAIHVDDVEASIDLTMAVEYGKSIPQITDQVRRAIVSQVEGMLGMTVSEVNITVTDVIFPDPNQNDTRTGQRPPRTR